MQFNLIILKKNPSQYQYIFFSVSIPYITLYPNKKVPKVRLSTSLPKQTSRNSTTNVAFVRLPCTGYSYIVTHETFGYSQGETEG